MTVIGVVLLAFGFVVALALALADPVLLSRVNGEHAEGGSGRHIQAPPVGAGGEIVRLPRRHVPGRGSRAA